MKDAERGAAHHALDAELRFATVVKCDVVDSTRIWGRLDPSDGLKLTRAFKKAVEEVVKRHGGYVDRWEGDGALILFGYPDASEDTPETAVRAGLELVKAVRSVRVADAKLQFRVGIASGSLAVDLISNSPDGLTINIAERLKALAKPGCVVIADKTKDLAKSFFKYKDLGTLPAKGFDQGLRAWRAVRETAVVSRFEAQRFDKSRGEIIGRSAELAALADSWSKSRDGKGQVVRLVGDAGMGKSRLARAVLDWASRDGSTMIEIDCTPSTRNSPLFPVGVLLRRTAGIGAATSETKKSNLAKQLLARLLAENEVSGALNYLAPLFGLQAIPIPSNNTPEQVQEQTISTVVRMLRALAAQGSLAVLCEDLHWADDTTAKVVQRIAEDIAELPTMLIVTTRSRSDAPLDLKKIETFCKEITLEPLPGPAAADLVRSVAKGAALSADLVQGIVSRCEGVPLILEEVTRSTLEAVKRGETVNFDAASRGEVPAPLQLVVQARLERWKQYKPIVQAASVLGREFSIGHLQQMFPDQKEDVVKAIDLLADYGLFAQHAASAGDRARFTHAMICDAVYKTVLREDQEQLHSRAADTLIAGQQGTQEASPDVLAHHLREATRFVEAIRVRLAACEDTVKRGAYVETDGHCDAALRDIDKVVDKADRRKLEFSLLIQQGVARTGIYGYAAPEVEHAYGRARKLCDDRAKAETLYPIMRGLATMHLVRGDLATAYDYSLEGLKLAERSNRPEHRIDAMSVLCYTTLYYGQLADCRSWIERCLKLYGEEGGEKFRYPVPQDAATAALALLPTVAWLLGDSQAAEEAIDRGLKHVERLGRDFDKALLHAWIAGTRYTQRRYMETLKHAGIAYALGKEHKFEEWEGVGAMMALLAQSALQPAPDAVTQAIETGQKFKEKGVGLNASYYLWGIARGLVNAANAQGAQALLDAALGAAAASQETRMNPEIWILKAELETDDAKAIRLLKDAHDLADRQGAVANALRAAVAMALRSGGNAPDLARARAALDMLDGRATPDPNRARWMHEHLADIKRVVNTLLPAAQGA